MEKFINLVVSKVAKYAVILFVFAIAVTAGVNPLYIAIGLVLWVAFLMHGLHFPDAKIDKTLQADGTLKTWRSELPHLTVEADFDLKTIRIVAKNVTFYDLRTEMYKQEKKMKTVDVTIPMIGLSYDTYEIKKPKHTYATSVSSGTTWVNGQQVIVQIPVTVATDNGTTMVKTGSCIVSFYSKKSTKEVWWPGTKVLACGTSPSNCSIREHSKTKIVSIEFKLSEQELESFGKSWHQVLAQIKKVEELDDQAILDADHEIETKNILDREQNARKMEEQKAKSKTRAITLCSEALKTAGIEGDESDYTWSTETGDLRWLIATNKVDKGLISVGAENWIGPMRGAKASMIDNKGALEMEVEVVDQDYEREHLRRRRLRLMQNCTKERILKWVDIFNILGERG